MKYFILVLAVCLIPLLATAEPDAKTDELAEEFSAAMGIDKLLEATLQQMRDSLRPSMEDLSSNLLEQYPHISEEKIEKFDEVLKVYMDSIIDSIDTEEAAKIYANAISDGLPPREIEAATDYYNSPEGQKLLEVVTAASSQLNQYILGQVGASTKIAQAQLSKDLAEVLANP